MSDKLLCELWMGSVQWKSLPCMSENYLKSAFEKLGEKPLSAKVVKNRFTGEIKGFAFVQFQSVEEAKRVLEKLDGAVIPKTAPHIHLKLKMPDEYDVMLDNPAKMAVTEKDYILCVMDLSLDVDDYSFSSTFKPLYKSIHSAYVIFNGNGFSKGYGFLRFNSKEEQVDCLKKMNGFKGLGSNPLKISYFAPANHSSNNKVTQDSIPENSCLTFEQAYWHSYLSCQKYHDVSPHTCTSTDGVKNMFDTGNNKEDELEVVDYSTKVDVEKWNMYLVHRDYNLWDALESSKWMPLNMCD